uniref:Uncharacterized protein n=1 Tax=Anguilla anguilla TaxID=7936 RepID=A0A0E9UCT9_ANGAN
MCLFSLEPLVSVLARRRFRISRISVFMFSACLLFSNGGT